MNQQLFDSSIMFKHMLEQNKSLAGKVPQVRPRMASLLECTGNALEGDLAILTLQVADFHLKFSGIGMEAGLACLRACLDEAIERFSAVYPEGALHFIQEASPGDYVLLFEHDGRDPDELFFLYLAYRAAVTQGATERMRLVCGEEIDLRVGFARLEPDRDMPPTAVLFAAVCKAKRLAQQKIDAAAFPSPVEIKNLFAQGFTGVVYQPVVDLVTGMTIGWEAYARGTSGIPIQDALRLFELTGSTEKALEVEQGLCRLAVSGIGRLKPRQKLFLNVGPATLCGHDIQPREFARLIGEFDLERNQMVLEFSERLSFSELAALPEILDAYRDLGFLTAIDDVGAGQSNMMLLARLRPDFFKADITLTRDIECNPFKRLMVETLVLMAEKTGAKVIAEGVETELALSSLVSMGVHAGQGYYLGAPAYPKPEGGMPMPPKASFGQASVGDWKCSSPVGDLLAPCLEVDTEKRVGDVKALLADKPAMCSVVVVEGRTPAGLLMNYNLDKALSSKFGIDLYHRKRITRLMDASPLCVECDTPIEEAARLAMNRVATKIYDDIVITLNGELRGTVSVQKMLDTLAKVQVELAKGSNPLTGLPGNVAIEQEFQRRGREKLPCSMMYVDLDNFKVYNDVYGFSQGDKVILLTSRVLREAVSRQGSPGDFVGHVGGDDFVVIAARGAADAVADAVVTVFATEVPRLYTPEDRDRGFIRGKSRDGMEKDFPLITLSIGILECLFAAPITFEDLSHRVAEVKKFAKSRAGNSVVRDRRAPLGAL
ncbi:bifunctional diguanylate cyclase/phosphodiesterase [Solidesulfovibrio sp. C21]|uniref:bifunctional diguanylate cyclase/phosphodiesterase n=1 Tax=Solidesulfovibrio sp. C21 TaxID=3398613 RepID=UPI0039FD1C90